MAGAQVVVALTQLEKQRFGYQAISLTNFEADTEPQIAAGSKVEVGGALYEFSGAESITGFGGIGAGNDVYIKLTVAGTAITASWTTTAPAWSTSKQGWYDSLTRYIGGCYKDADGDYAQKYLFEGRQLTHVGGAVDNYGEVGFYKASVIKVRLGWLWCNGDTIDKTANPEYTALVDMLKQEAGADAAHPFYAVAANEAVLPDMRGSVIRGVDDAANRDKDGVRKSGGYQADDNKTHLHVIDHGHTTTGAGAHTHTINFRDAAAGPGTARFQADETDTVSDASMSDMDNPGDHTHPVVNHSGNSGATGDADEATVKNVAAYILIKY